MRKNLIFVFFSVFFRFTVSFGINTNAGVRIGFLTYRDISFLTYRDIGFGY